MQKFEKLLDKLIKEGKLDKLEIFRKLGLKSEAVTSSLNIGSSHTQKRSGNILEERESSQSNDVLLDEHIMADEDSQIDDNVIDEDHVASEASRKTASNNLYKFRNSEADRPKTSTGNHRDPNSEDKMSQLEKINMYHKHLEEKKKGGARPLSGGL